MIISKTPFRMSFLGGGTDIPSFFSEYGGSVISSTFDKYCFINVRHLPRFFDYKNQFTYSKIERLNELDEIEHPAIREAMKMLDMHEIILSYDADLPARTGLGSSSSFAVGLLNAFYALKGKYVDKGRLASEAIYLERELCGEAGGWQDQIEASYGGFNRIDFNAEGFTVSPVIISRERKKQLNDNLLLYFTGFSRFSAEIQDETIKHMKDNTSRLVEMKSLVDDAEKILIDKEADLNEFGHLLDYSWHLKKGTGSNISTNAIDEIYVKAIKAGALGGKLLGAGGGGFLLFYVPLDIQSVFKQSLSDLLYVPFKFENNGTSIIYYSPEEYSPA